LLVLAVLQIGVDWRPDLFAPANLLLFAAICTRRSGSALKAPRSNARLEAKNHNQQGRAASATGSDGINSAKLRLLTALPRSHPQPDQRARELGSVGTSLRTRAM
jgi:hypothetical protein